MKNLLYLLLVSCFFIACNTGQNSQSKEEENSELKPSGKALPVTVTVVNQSVFDKQILSNGKIEALQKSELRFKTTERIHTIYVKNGQPVKKGQLLASLDNQVLANQLQKAQIELDKAKQKLQEEKINFGGGDTLQITQEVLKNLQISSGFLEAQNNLQNAQLLYNQTLLKAPFSGVVANIEAKEGDYITPSDAFCTLISQNKLQVVFSILENNLPFVTNGQPVTITPFANPETQYTGKITEINPFVDENGLIKIKALLSGGSNNLFDGLNVKVIINKPLQNVIVIPKEALVLRSNREVVFTVQQDLAKWNYVETLDENTTSYAIKKGLKIGDTIIISGNMNLSHDAKVTPSFKPKEDKK